MDRGTTPHTRKPVKEHKKPLVLVVDGNMVSQFTTSVILQRLDYHIFPVKTAEDALSVISLATPHVILTEITLPQMNGVDLLKKLKNDKQTKDIPVIIYTASKDPAYRQVCAQEGSAAYLVYPADHNELYEALQKVTEATPRHFVRLTTFLDVIVGVEGIPGHVVRKEKVSALSLNGMYVNTTKPLPFGTVFPFSIILRNNVDGGIHVEGKVLYSHDGRRGGIKQPGMGVKFTLIRHEDRDLIQAYIREKLMEGIAIAVH